MYAEFLKTLAEIAELLDKAAQIGSVGGSPPTPYIAGTVEVRLDGEHVGYFRIEDDYVLYNEGLPDNPPMS